MLKPKHAAVRQNIFRVTAVLLGLGILFFLYQVVEHTSWFEDCVETQKSTYPAQDNNPVNWLLFHNRITVDIQCWGRFSYAYRDAITAIATVLLAIVTTTLWMSTSAQAKLTRASINLAREEFTASHRPEFAIHSIRLIEPLLDQNTGQKRICAEFVIINCGSGAGTLNNASVNLTFAPEQDRVWMNKLLTSPNVLDLRRYGVGSSDTQRVYSDFTSAASYYDDHRLLDAFLGATHRLYFHGWLVYSDDLKGRRNAYFCREYNEDTRGFTLIYDPDANQTY